MLENDEDALWWQDGGIKTYRAWRVVWKIVQKIKNPPWFAQAVTVFQNRQIFQNLKGRFWGRYRSLTGLIMFPIILPPENKWFAFLKWPFWPSGCWDTNTSHDCRGKFSYFRLRDMTILVLCRLIFVELLNKFTCWIRVLMRSKGCNKMVLQVPENEPAKKDLTTGLDKGSILYHFFWKMSRITF